MWQRGRTLIVKEFLAVWQDKKSRTVLIIPPIIQLLVFSFAATLEVTNVSMVVWNEDSGKYSRDLIEKFQASTTFKRIDFYHNQEEIEEAINTQRAIMVLHIGQNFSKDLLESKLAKVQLILDGRKTNSAQIVQGYAQRLISQYQNEIASELHFPVMQTELDTRNWYNPNLIYTWFTVPGLTGILIMLVGLLVTSLSVARERELGTFEQLLVTPLVPLEILLGKLIPGIIIGFIEGTFILFAAVTVFQIPFTGSLPLLLISMVVFVTSIVGIGLFLSSLSNTQQQAILGVFSFMVPSVALSGFATPIENMPEFLQIATLANPMRHYLVIVRGLFLKDLSFAHVWSSTYPMLLIAACNLLGATWYFRKKLE